MHRPRRLPPNRRCRANASRATGAVAVWPYAGGGLLGPRRRTAVTSTQPFAGLPDPRVNRAKRHRSDDTPATAPRAAIAGVERLGGARRGWLKRFPALPNGTPGHGTFDRVPAALDREALAAGPGRWAAGSREATGRRAIATGGGAVRGAPGDTPGGGPRPVGPWAAGGGVPPGQEAVAGGSPEAAAAPGPLAVPDLVDLEGALVTLGAAGCREGIAAHVRGRGGGYPVAAEGNPRVRRGRARRGRPRAARGAVRAVRGGGPRPRGIAARAGGRWRGGGGRPGAGGQRRERRHGPRRPHGPAGDRGRVGRAHPRALGGGGRVARVPRRHLPGGASRTRGTTAGADRGVARRAAAPPLEQDPARGSTRAERLDAALDPRHLERVLRGFKAD